MYPGEACADDRPAGSRRDAPVTAPLSSSPGRSSPRLSPTGNPPAGASPVDSGELPSGDPASGDPSSGEVLREESQDGRWPALLASREASSEAGASSDAGDSYAGDSDAGDAGSGPSDSASPSGSSEGAPVDSGSTFSSPSSEDSGFASFPGDSVGSGSSSGKRAGAGQTRAVNSISRTLFHFFRLEKQPDEKQPQKRGSEGITAKQPSTDSTKTKDFDDVPAVNFPDINALTVSRNGRVAFAGMNSGDLVRLTLTRVSQPPVVGHSSGSRKTRPAAASPSAGGTLESRLELRRRVLLHDPRPILAVAISKNERYLALTRFGLVQIYDLRKEKLLSELTKVETRLVAIDWDPRTELVVFGGIGGDIYTWNVFNGPASGRDSLDAVEKYEAEAPVVALLFHPSARAFFAALQDGTVSFWRLLRTERELGLRDDGAVMDTERQKGTSTQVGTLPGRPESVWLEEGGERLFVSAADGKVHRWVVRGLERQTDIFLGTEQSTNVQQLPFVFASAKEGTRRAGLRPFVASGRGQRLSLYCPKAPDERLNSSAVTVVPSGAPTEAPPSAIIVDGRIEELGTPTPTPTPIANTAVPIAPFAESLRLDSPLSHFAVGADSAVLWAVQKGGTLVVFDAAQLKHTPWFSKSLENCLAQPGK